MLKKYDWVDALRGYAILLVILIHTGQMFQINFLKNITIIGDMGVQLFFIMSSFTLFNSYNKRMREDGKYRKRIFFIRRFFRIAPYYYIAGVIYILYAILIQKATINWKYILANYTFLNGIYLPAINYIPPGGWSIGIEMLFYLLIPLLCKYINSLKKSIFLLIGAIIASNIINYGLFYFFSNYTHYKWIELRGWTFYFWLPNQLPVFIVGIVLYFIFIKKKIEVKYGKVILMSSIVLFSVLLMVKFRITYPYYFLQREYVYSLVFLGIAIGLSLSNNKILINKYIKKIGIVSFSAYLNHFIILYITRYTINKIGILFQKQFNIQEPYINDVLFCFEYIFVVYVTYMVSKYTYQKIELRGVSIGEKITLKLKTKIENN